MEPYYSEMSWRPQQGCATVTATVTTSVSRRRVINNMVHLNAVLQMDTLVTKPAQNDDSATPIKSRFAENPCRPNCTIKKLSTLHFTRTANACRVSNVTHREVKQTEPRFRVKTNCNTARALVRTMCFHNTTVFLHLFLLWSRAQTCSLLLRESEGVQCCCAATCCARNSELGCSAAR